MGRAPVSQDIYIFTTECNLATGDVIEITRKSKDNTVFHSALFLANYFCSLLSKRMHTITPIRVIVTSVELHNRADLAGPVVFTNVSVFCMSGTAVDVFKRINHSLLKYVQYFLLLNRMHFCSIDYVPLFLCRLTECLSMSNCAFTELTVSLDEQVDSPPERCLRGVNTVSMVSTGFPHSRKSPLKSRMW